MTAPALSPQEPAKRSKRLYVYWGAALALLVTLGLVCWLVVVPLMQVRKMAQSCAEDARFFSMSAAYNYRDYIQQLGGESKAFNKLGLYLRAPKCLTEHREVAAFLLGQCGEPAVPLLTSLISDPDQEVREKTLWALQQVGPGAGEAVPALTVLVGDKTQSLRSTAAYTLGRIGPAAVAAIPVLEEALRDSDPDVRRAAAGALKKIRGGEKR